MKFANKTMEAILEPSRPKKKAQKTKLEKLYFQPDQTAKEL